MLLASASLVACSAVHRHVSPSVIVDTDVMDDDMAAIAALFLSGGRAVPVGFTVVGTGGCSSAQAGAHTLARFLKAVNREGIPIRLGSNMPQDHGNHSFSPATRHRSDLIPDIYNLPNASVPGTNTTESAAEYLVRITRARPGELTLLAIGPMTNVAEALRLDRDFLGRLRRFVWMGGGIATVANDTPHNASEWNFWCDTHAARRALAAVQTASFAPGATGMSGLDATAAAVVDSTLVDALQAASEAAATTRPASWRMAASVLLDAARTASTWRSSLLYDAVAALDAALGVGPAGGEAALTELFVRRELPITVLVNDSLVDGRTVVDQQAGAMMTVNMKMQRDVFRALLLRLLQASAHAGAGLGA